MEEKQWEGDTGMGIFGFHGGFVKPHALRKKSVLLLLLIGIALIALCLQYNTTVRTEAELRKGDVQNFHDGKYGDVIVLDDMLQKSKMKSVQFLAAGGVTSGEQAHVHEQSENERSPLKQFLSKMNGKLPDQPSRDEISRRRSSLDLYTGDRVVPEVTTAPFNPDIGVQGLMRNMKNVDDQLGSMNGVYFQMRGKDEARNDMYDSTLYSMGIPAVDLDSYVPKQRLVHFDLKGAPPKVSYIKKVIALSKQLGATGLLMEYEDMFPFWGPLSTLAAGNAYSKSDIEDILATAKANDLDVIPLVQTFGHVEFALKLKKFADLREVPESPQALCPSNNASLDLVENLIDQVMKLHPSVKHLHIGCDEVFQMGECPKCRLQPRYNLFLSHVTRVAGYVKKNYPKVTPIIWDDMLRHLPTQSLEEFHLGELVEPMVWVYAEDIYRFVPSLVWEKYAEIFPRVWAASAFKGAFGETMYVPNAKRHLENNLRWLEVMTAERQKFKGGFAGIVLTGWQRYDHFAVLCELLPAGIPSLAINLLATSHGYFNQSLRSKLLTPLNCQSDSHRNSGIVNFYSDPFMWNKLSRCFFPGSSFYKLLYRLNTTEKEVKEFLDTTTRSKGWMTDYNVEHNFSSPLRVDELMADFPRVYNSLTSLERHARESLEEIFDQYTVNEWIEQRIYPSLRKLQKLDADATNLKNVRYWPRRPLKSAPVDSASRTHTPSSPPAIH
ncbi:hypothetical protein RUM44_001442 [Polyplax serrata]|uniref:beta-N-acetylhexosaminidase n=1 Tax=Polyplax serrata TaxID=468196 RepID=A0ABR1AK37_POLSC